MENGLAGSESNHERVHSFVTGVLGLSRFDALVRVFPWDNVSRDLDYENRLMGEFGALLFSTALISFLFCRAINLTRNDKSKQMSALKSARVYKHKVVRTLVI